MDLTYSIKLISLYKSETMSDLSILNLLLKASSKTLIEKIINFAFISRHTTKEVNNIFILMLYNYIIDNINLYCIYSMNNI